MKNYLHTYTHTGSFFHHRLAHVHFGSLKMVSSDATRLFFSSFGKYNNMVKKKIYKAFLKNTLCNKGQLLFGYGHNDFV